MNDWWWIIPVALVFIAAVSSSFGSSKTSTQKHEETQSQNQKKRLAEMVEAFEKKCESITDNTFEKHSVLLRKYMRAAGSNERSRIIEELATLHANHKKQICDWESEYLNNFSKRYSDEKHRVSDLPSSMKADYKDAIQRLARQHRRMTYRMEEQIQTIKY